MREQIDKNLKWILTIIGFVSGIAMFIVAMRRDFYLYATVIGAILLVGGMVACGYIAFAREKTSEEGKKPPYRYARGRYAGLSGMFLIGLLALGLLAARPTRSFIIVGLAGTPTPTATSTQRATPTAVPTQTPTPEPTEVVLPKADVLIAEFDNRLATRQIEVARRLEADLQKRLRQYGLEDINVKVVSQPVTNEDEAQSVANQTESKVVIWGWYDDLGINVRIFLSGGDQPGKEIPGSGEIPLVGSAGADPAFVIRDVLPENTSFLSLFVIGHLYYLNNQTEPGRAAFDAAMDSLPKTATIENLALLHFFKARQLDFNYSEESDPQQAELSTIICEYAKAIELDPKFAEAYNNLGVVLAREIYYPFYDELSAMATTCLEQAGVADYTSLFDRALELNPDWTLPAYNKWVTYWTREAWTYWEYEIDAEGNPAFNRRMEVIRGLEEVVRREPSFNAARVALSQIALEGGDLEEAVRWMKEAASQDVSRPQDHYNLGQLYLRQGDVPAARAEFEKALEGDPRDPEAHLALAGLALQGGEEQAAGRHLQLIPSLKTVPNDTWEIKYDVNYPTTVEAMAEILRSELAFREGDLGGAVQPLENSVTIHDQFRKNTGFEHYLLGLLYALQGDTEVAEENWAHSQDDFYLGILGGPIIIDMSNATSAQTWYSLVDDCGDGDVMEWGSAGNPCLPVEMSERVEAVYDRFHKYMTFRGYYVRSYPHLIAECPFVFTYDPIQGAWGADTTLLYRLVGPQGEASQWRALDHFDGRLLVWELEPEISYFDRLSVRVLDRSGRMWTLETDLPALQRADGEYLVLQRGERLRLDFPEFGQIQQPQQVWVVAEGYYERSDR